MPPWITDLGNVVRKLGSSSLALPSAGRIPFEQCLPRESVGSKINEGQSYFSLIINEMHLDKANKLWKTYVPAVFVIVDFTYNKTNTSVPALIGPNLLKLPAELRVPTGLVMQDTTVVGPHPFRGGALGLTVVLCRVQAEDSAVEFFRFVEGVAGAVGTPADIQMLSKVGSGITNALSALLKLGQTVSIAGHRIEMHAGDYPGKHLIIALVCHAQVGGHAVRIVYICDRRRKMRLARQQDVLGASSQICPVLFGQCRDRKRVPAKRI